MATTFRAWPALLLLLALVGGCKDAVTSEKKPLPVIRSMRIDPRPTVMSPGQSQQFRAVFDADPGADTSIVWSINASTTGTLSPTGLLSVCWPPGFVLVRVDSRAVPSLSDSLLIPVLTNIPPGTVTLLGVGPLGWQVGTPLPPSFALDSLTGDVDFIYRASAQPLVCRGGDQFSVRLRNSTVDTLISLDFQPPFSDTREIRVRVRTKGLPNGAYVAWGSVRATGLTTALQSNGASVSIKNP